MPLHSPLAAVLAGVELTLRKAQDWEQHAHRGVSLKDELRSLSALVVRWRALELKSWPQLLDAREDAFVRKVGGDGGVCVCCAVSCVLCFVRRTV